MLLLRCLLLVFLIVNHDMICKGTANNLSQPGVSDAISVPVTPNSFTADQTDPSPVETSVTTVEVLKGNLLAKTENLYDSTSIPHFSNSLGEYGTSCPITQAQYDGVLWRIIFLVSCVPGMILGIAVMSRTQYTNSFQYYLSFLFIVNEAYLFPVLLWCVPERFCDIYLVYYIFVYYQMVLIGMFTAALSMCGHITDH